MLDPLVLFTRRGAVSGVSAHTHRQCAACLPRTNIFVTLASDLIDRAGKGPSQTKGKETLFILLCCLQQTVTDRLTTIIIN